MESEFYEEDEPADKVWAAFDRGDKQLTERPIEGFHVRSGKKFRMNGNVARSGVPVSVRA